MILAWRAIATLKLTKQWQYTKLTSSTFFRISHAIDSQRTGTLRGAIGQSLESIVFDRRLIGYRPGLEEGQLFINPDEFDSRQLALQRLDDLPVVWTVKIEELINLATNLPLSIDEVAGLQDLLNGKASNQHQHEIQDINNLRTVLDEKLKIADFADSEELILAQIAQKSAIGHNHEIAEVIGLAAALSNAIAVVSNSVPAFPFPGMLWHEVTASGEIIESWNYFNGKWKSQSTYTMEYFAGSSSLAGGVSYVIPLKQGVDYFFMDFQGYVLYSSASPIDTTTNFWRILWGMQQTGINVANTEALSFGNISRQYPLNILYSPVDGERMFCMFAKTGTPPGARLASTIRYKLVRR